MYRECLPSAGPPVKSHHGCLPCKKRKIKCDEEHPKCNKCITRGVDCQYQILPIKSFKPSSLSCPENSATSQPTPSWEDFQPPLTAESSHPLPQLDERQDAAHTISTAQPYLDHYSRSDFELLHHYTTNTYRSLAMTSALAVLWSETVPKEAFAHDFLLHGILGLAAFHLSHLRPAQKIHYDTLAKQHHSLSLSSFRKQLEAPSPDAGDAMLAFSIITVVTTCANAGTVERTTDGGGRALDDLLSVTAMQRGVAAIVGAMPHLRLEGGILGPMIALLRTPATTEDLPSGIQVALDHLAARCRDYDTLDAAIDYSAAIEHLRSSFWHALSANRQLVAFEWLVHVSEGFLAAARARDGPAVAILAHFGVILHYCRDFWWIGDEGRSIVEEAAKVLGDGSDWADWARSEVAG